MIVNYYFNKVGAFITRCPNEIIKEGVLPRMVGSLACKSCEYFVREHLKSVICKYSIDSDYDCEGYPDALNPFEKGV